MRSAAPPLPEVGTAWIEPSSVEDACWLLSELAGSGRPVAGCTMLTPLALAADREIRVAVDVTALPELNVIEEEEGELRIGATVTAQQVAVSPAVSDHAPMLAAAAAGIGDEVVRGMATIGGNVATRVQAPVELPIVLAALEASVQIASPRGLHAIGAAELSDPHFSLGQDELIAQLIVPTAPKGTRWSYRKLTTNLDAYGVACLALRYPPTGQPAAFAGLGSPLPQRLPIAERWLASGTADADPDGVAAEACEALVSVGDALASAGYRLRGLEAILEEELRRLKGNAE